MCMGQNKNSLSLQECEKNTLVVPFISSPLPTVQPPPPSDLQCTTSESHWGYQVSLGWTLPPSSVYPSTSYSVGVDLVCSGSTPLQVKQSYFKKVLHGVCVCVCVCVCVHVRGCMCVCVWLCMCIGVCMDACVCVCGCACVLVFVWMHVCVCVCVCVWLCMRIGVCTWCVCTCMCVCGCVCVRREMESKIICMHASSTLAMKTICCITVLLSL